jgi:hypothetical protein
MRKYWWAFVANEREVVAHPSDDRETAWERKERFKRSQAALHGWCRVGASVRRATRDEVRAWAAHAYPGRKITLLD